MKFTKGSIFTILFLCSCYLTVAQFKITEKPKGSNQTSVYDYIDILYKEQKQGLEQKLIRYSDSTSTPFVMEIIASTEGENISFLGANGGNQWGFGQANEDNGI